MTFYNLFIIFSGISHNNAHLLFKFCKSQKSGKNSLSLSLQIIIITVIKREFSLQLRPRTNTWFRLSLFFLSFFFGELFVQFAHTQRHPGLKLRKNHDVSQTFFPARVKQGKRKYIPTRSYCTELYERGTAVKRASS